MVTDDLPAALDRLVALGQNRDVNIRPVLLRVLVDLFVSKTSHATEDVLQFEEIAGRLLEEADPAARLIVAAKLSQHPLTPKGMLKRLVSDRGAVATTVLASARLDEASLQAAAVLGSAEMVTAVARRPDLTPQVIRAVAERPETAVVQALLSNPNATIDAATQRHIVRRARASEPLAAALLARQADPISLAPLFLFATRAQRREILTAFRRHDLGLTVRAEPVPQAEHALVQIERAVRLPKLEGLDFALCHALGFSQNDAEAVVDDRHGEPLAVALAALGASPELAARVFILGNPAIGHVYSAVKRLVDIVDTTSIRAARRLIGAITGTALTGTGPFQDVDRAFERTRRSLIAREPARTDTADKAVAEFRKSA